MAKASLDVSIKWFVSSCVLEEEEEEGAAAMITVRRNECESVLDEHDDDDGVDIETHGILLRPPPPPPPPLTCRCTKRNDSIRFLASHLLLFRETLMIMTATNTALSEKDKHCRCC